MLVLRSGHRYVPVSALINPVRVNELASHLERTRIAIFRYILTCLAMINLEPRHIYGVNVVHVDYYDRFKCALSQVLTLR